MINRVLIRIKVIQMLYSYLLTESNFMLEDMSGQPTKEKRFAHKLYIDTLVLMVRLARNITSTGGRTPLLHNRFMDMISSDERIRAALTQSEAQDLYSLIPSLEKSIKESAIYKFYIKGEPGNLNADIKVWKEIFDIIISSDAEYAAVISRRQGYSLHGFDRMKELMETTFKSFMTSQGYISDALKSLSQSMDKARELYMRLLLLPLNITELREQQIEMGRNKMLPTAEDLNPNLRFVENGLVKELRQNVLLREYASRNNIDMIHEDSELLNGLLNKIIESDIYQKYMSAPEVDYNADCELWRNLLKDIVFNDADFLDEMESKSVFWNDDLDVMGTFVLKTIKRFEEGLGQNAILPMYKDEEDAKFGEELFSAVIRNKDEYRAYIDKSIRKELWETDRLAFMDVVIIMTAIAELLNFPKIPVKVTMNEYIEMAKSYSTPRSGFFVNGILGVIVAMLKRDGKLQKPE